MGDPVQVAPAILVAEPQELLPGVYPLSDGGIEGITSSHVGRTSTRQHQILIDSRTVPEGTSHLKIVLVFCLRLSC